MKNVLFATTALVAMAGMANAASHGGMSPVVSFSGDMTAGYNDVIEGGMFYDASLDVKAVVDMGDSVTATLTAGLFTGNETGGTFSFNPTVEIAYTGTFDASLRVGDMNDKGASEYFYKDRSGMAVDVENQDNATDARALLQFGNFGVAAGCQLGGTNSCQGLNVGAGATFGSIKLGVGYDDATGGQSGVTAASADATFGAMSIGLSFAKGTSTYTAKTGVDGNDADANVGGTDTTLTGAETSIGVKLGYEISSALSVGAYYASNSVLGAQYGASVSYSSGALGVKAYYDQSSKYTLTPAGVDADGDGYYTIAGTAAFATSNAYGIDLSYDISDALTASAGVKAGGTTVYYAGIEYAVNSNISATVSYATADAISGPEFKNGISAFITAEF